MVSTYLSYDLVNRDMFKTLQRVASDQQVAREAQYYQENIGKVSTIEEFMDDYRLYSYAMKAYGLEEMTYAKAFMKKVLESDLGDPNSYANLLTDERYKTFAAGFSFSASGATPIAQSAAQQEDMLELYDQSILAMEDAVAEETRYYKVMIAQVDNVDDILQNDRLRQYVFGALGIDDSVYSYDVVRQAMTSDKDDPNSYTNTVLKDQMDYLAAKLSATQAELAALGNNATEHVEKKTALKAEIAGYQKAILSTQAHIDLAGAFEFAADGTSAKGAAQTEQQLAATTDLYLLGQPRQTRESALREREYFEQKITAVTNVDELLDDPRLYDYVRKAFNLDELYVVKSTLEQILTSDLSDPKSYANLYAEERPQYIELAKAFNFNTDGTVNGTQVQTVAQTQLTANNYFSRYDDKQEEADEKAISLYKSEMAAVKSIDDFLSDEAIYGFALKAVGLDPDSVSMLTLKNVLKSDLSDPKSYVYGLKDERYLTLAQAFNFTRDGSVTAPIQAQSPATVTATAKEYIVQQTRFLKGAEEEAAREKADAEASYYTSTMAGIKTLNELLADRRLVDFILTAKGLDPQTVTDDFLRQVFGSDLEDPESFVNQQTDSRFAEILGTFNFDASGNLDRNTSASVQNLGQTIETQQMYLRQTLETEQGNENAGVRLALYFERMAGSITDAYGIIGDEALAEFVRIAFSLPSEMANMDVDQQAKLIEKHLTLSDLSDPQKLQKLIQRFTILYDLETGSTGPSPVDILTGASAYSGISADTLWSLSQLRQ
ncbi:hypothetical protein ABID21_000347 [Pseudorhizobium tarimense]|uniref:Flagellar protein n=1 Tax=Pseudorhizobium tarimense TaxID=1079109 RepID=A0ABV2H139_9HYPH|nr:DUF1217 domain-containing protein [Pseudorhizobium tarimense]MCJ8517576.1 DUF1217 domain-containing protein [Pseudorhizobium tarimense]